MSQSLPVVLVSACLLGQAVRYDGQSKAADLSELINQGIALIPICPERAGGLPIPRDPCEIAPCGSSKGVLEGRDRIMSNKGKDCTEQYCRGARFCLAIAKKYHVSFALLKEKSPACGSTLIHSGYFDGTLIKGRGIASELLSQNGIKVFNEQRIDQLITSIKISQSSNTIGQTRQTPQC